MTFTSILFAHLQADKTAYCNFSPSTHFKPGYSPRTTTKIRRVHRIIAKRGMFEMSNESESFDVTFKVTARISINKEVFKQVDEEWKKMFYDLGNINDIVEMIAYNMLIWRSLSNLDGFANFPNNYADWEIDPEYELEDIEKVN